MVAKVVPEEKVCQACPRTFLVGGALHGKRSRKFCSQECSRKGYAPGPKAKLPRQMSSTEAAYLAGLIDGDGHVALYTGGAKKALSLTLQIANTNQELLAHVERITGAGSTRVQHKETSNRKQTYTWRCGGSQAAAVLAQVIPCMVGKKERAELGIEYTAECKAHPERRKDAIWQEQTYRRMRALNKRGPAGYQGH